MKLRARQMTKLSLNTKLNSVSLERLLCSVTVERMSDYRWVGFGSSLVSFSFFLIASPTLIGTIYHSLQPRSSRWKFPQGYLILLTAQPPFNAQNHLSLNGTHPHRSDPTAVTQSEDHHLLHSNRFLSDMSKEMLKETLNTLRLHSCRGRWASPLKPATNLSHTPSFSATITVFITCIK